MNQSKFAHSRIDIIGSNGNDAEIYHHLHKHGHRPKAGASPTYATWLSMKSRCNRPESHNYHLYGARGISICERWSDFVFFLADMGERPEGKTLDRIDPNGNYEKENCRWATTTEQSRNKRDSIVTEIFEVSMNLVDIADYFEVPRTTIYRRYHQGLRGSDLIDRSNRNKYRCGEKSSASKLSNSDVLEIRALSNVGVTQAVIAKSFSVSQTTISEIVNRKIWGHI